MSRPSSLFRVLRHSEGSQDYMGKIELMFITAAKGYSTVSRRVSNILEK